MGNQTIFNVKDPTVADHGVNKGYVDSKIFENEKKGNEVTIYANNQYRSIMNFIARKTDQTYVNTTFLKLSGGTMTGPIHMNGEKITDLKTATLDTDAATKKFVANKVEKKKDSIIDSHSLKDEIRYIMEDVNESSSESNIRVDGIVDLSKSPHKHNKNAYDLKLIKNSNNNYVSRLGFNMYKLPEGEYTICVEFFPVKMVNASVNAISSSLNVGQQATTLFTQEGYSRSIIHIHKWQISPPEYLMLDLHCGDETPSPTQGQAYLIIYGVKGKYSDVPTNVFDQPFVFESGKMVMETDLDLNGKSLLNFNPPISSKSKSSSFGKYNYSKNRESIVINDNIHFHVFGVDLTIKKVTLRVTSRSGILNPSDTAVKIAAGRRSSTATGVQVGKLRAISYSFDFAASEDEEF